MEWIWQGRRQRRRHAGQLLRQRHSLPADRGLSGEDHRGRRHRRRRPLDADYAAARVARGAGLRRDRDRLDAVRADAADHRPRQVEQHAEQADLRPALRHRLRRSAREGDHPGAQGRLHRAVGSLHLHGDGARRRPRRRSHLDPQPLRLRHRAAPRLLPQDRREDAHPARPPGARHGLLGIGHGHEARRRHLRELPRLPAGAPEGVRVDVRRVRLPRPRRPAQGRRHPGRAAPADRRVSGRERPVSTEAAPAGAPVP